MDRVAHVRIDLAVRCRTLLKFTGVQPQAGATYAAAETETGTGTGMVLMVTVGIWGPG